MELDPSAVIWNRDDRAGRPLLVILHGLGASERDFVPIFPMLPDDLAIASVRAPIDFAPGAAWFQPQQSDALAREMDESTDALVRWVATQSGHPSVGILGFSQGGAIAVHTLRRAPELADYAVSLAGFLPGVADDTALGERRTPLFIGYGLADDVVPRAWTDMLVDWATPLTEVATHFYPGLTHAVSEEEIADASAFIRAHLP
ncbi:alpha/beta hydrolase [Pseudolysinimonas kribbensis]|nr:alpha/beta fold hydrolase [Pseudolysinimonas kribbensis]